MDPLNDFQSKESEKLTGWVSQILASKEARVFTTDALAAGGQRAQVSTEVSEISDSPTPPVPVSESKASAIPNGDVDLSDYYTKDEIDDKFEEYYTIEEIDDKFKEYYTIEEIDSKFDEYYTKSQIDNILDDYATKDWVTNALLSYPTWTETNQTYVDWGTFNDFPASSQFADAVAAIVKANLGFEIQCNGDGTVTGNLKWMGI